MFLQELSQKKLPNNLAFLSTAIKKALISDTYEGEDNFIEWAESALSCGVQNKFHKMAQGKSKAKNNPFSACSRLEQFAANLHFRNWTDEEIRKGLSIVQQRIFKVLVRMPDGSHRIFDGRQKGTQAYNKYYKAKIIDTAKKLINLKHDLLALTVTCSARDYNFDRLAAWQDYTKKLNRLNKQLARKYQAKYIAVVEATKKGFPHAHIVLAVPKGKIKGYEKMKNKQKFIFGEFYNCVKKFAPAKIFCLEKICGKNTAWYLTKYISKYETNSFFSMIENKGKFKAEERKAATCLLYTILCGTRQFRMSTASSIARVADEQKQRELDFSVNAAQCEQASQESVSSRAAVDPRPDQDPPTEEGCSAQRYALIKRCINLPECCKSRVMAMPLSLFYKLFGNRSDRDVENDYKSVETFQRKGSVRGCRGCIYTHIYNFVMCRDDYVINPIIEYGENQFYRLFDGVDINSDFEFMKGFEAALQLISIAVNEKHLSLEGFNYLARHEGGISVKGGELHFRGINWRKEIEKKQKRDEYFKELERENERVLRQQAKQAIEQLEKIKNKIVTPMLDILF